MFYEYLHSKQATDIKYNISFKMTSSVYFNSSHLAYIIVTDLSAVRRENHIATLYRELREKHTAPHQKSNTATSSNNHLTTLQDATSDQPPKTQSHNKIYMNSHITGLSSILTKHASLMTFYLDFIHSPLVRLQNLARIGHIRSFGNT